MDSVTGELSEQEMLELASRLAWLRPLKPYPGWRFASAWDNPGMAFSMRSKIVEFVKARSGFPLLPFEWHYGTRVHLDLMDDGAQAVFVGGCIEPNELAFVDRFLNPGMTFIDAGAYLGLFTLLASRKVGVEGTVMAFEPSRREYEKLKENLRQSRISNTRIFPIALLDAEGEALLSIADDRHTGQNTLGKFVYDIQLLGKESVRTMPLDGMAQSWNLSRVDLIKIDVEGAELAVLRGARGVLASHRPVLLLELLGSALEKQSASCQELLELLKTHHYNLLSFDPDSGLPRPSMADEFNNNIIAVPDEKELPAL
jgi:FkbM family methyltransferase